MSFFFFPVILAFVFTWWSTLSHIPLNKILWFCLSLPVSSKYLPLRMVVSDMSGFLQTQLGLTNLLEFIFVVIIYMPYATVLFLPEIPSTK